MSAKPNGDVAGAKRLKQAWTVVLTNGEHYVFRALSPTHARHLAVHMLAAHDGDDASGPAVCAVFAGHRTPEPRGVAS